MKKQRPFEIVTLSDCNDCLSLQDDYSSLGQIEEIISGGLEVLNKILPQLFGGGRTKLTSADWQKLLPGNGAWTVRLRNRLAQTIHYDVDLGNMEPFTKYFVDDNKVAICGVGVPFSECFSRFLAILEQERFTGGTSPVGNIPGYQGTTNYSSLMTFGIIGIAAYLLLKGK